MDCNTLRLAHGASRHEPGSTLFEDWDCPPKDPGDGTGNLLPDLSAVSCKGTVVVVASLNACAYLV